MSKISPADTTLVLYLGSCWVSFWKWQYLQLLLHGIHCHIHLWQFFHGCWVGTCKDWIGLCRSFLLVTVCLNSLCGGVKFINHLVVLFWWGWGYTIDILYRRFLSPLSWVVDRSPLFLMISMEKGLEPGPFFEVSGFSSALFNVFVVCICLFQKGDPLGHHRIVGNRLPYCICKFSHLF